MAILIEGKPDPKRLAAEQRTAALTSVCQKHQGKTCKALKRQDKDELLTAILQYLGLADEKGKVLPPRGLA